MARAATRPVNDTPAQQPEEDKPTKRVVLRRERAILLPETMTEDALARLASGDGAKQLAKLLGLPESSKVPTACIGVEAWTVVGEFEGKSKTQAIEAHAGKPNTPDAKPGAYKAPTSAAFAGGALYEAPPQPLVERKALD